MIVTQLSPNDTITFNIKILSNTAQLQIRNVSKFKCNYQICIFSE